LEYNTSIVFYVNALHHTQIIPESDKNQVFRFLAFRIIFYVFANPENNRGTPDAMESRGFQRA